MIKITQLFKHDYTMIIKWLKKSRERKDGMPTETSLKSLWHQSNWVGKSLLSPGSSSSSSRWRGSWSTSSLTTGSCRSGVLERLGGWERPLEDWASCQEVHANQAEHHSWSHSTRIPPSWSSGFRKKESKEVHTGHAEARRRRRRRKKKERKRSSNRK